MEEHGTESWELDALEPTILAGLITDAVARYRDDEQWAVDERREEQHREELGRCAERWGVVCDYLSDDEGEEETEDDSEL